MATVASKLMKSIFRSSHRVRLSFVGCVLFGLTTACGGGDNGPSNTAQAGANTSGGNVATGGSNVGTGTGGSSSGGSSAAGGSQVSGGTSTTTSNAGTTTTGGTNATTGTSVAGGTTSSGGSSAIAGANSGMRDISSMQIVKEMHLGWNLGNTMDGNPLETSWGNPKTTQAMIDMVKAAGFNTVRIPVTWQSHMGAAPDYTVEQAWMNRVEEIANYVLSTGMYAIVNTHHDAWVSVMPTADQAAISTQITKLWTQIANRFKNYDDHLIFETLNEPRTTDTTQWTGGTPAARTIINAYNLAAVNAIRATGGNNQLRHIMVPTHAANASNTCVNALVIPNNDPRIIVSLHTYYPNPISMGGATTWGTAAEKADMAAELDRIANLLPKKGRAVVIGEWGTINQDNLAVRVDHAGTYAKEVTARGMCPVWWDNGGLTAGKDGFALLSRKATPLVWAFPEIVTALAAGATAGAAIAP